MHVLSFALTAVAVASLAVATGGRGPGVDQSRQRQRPGHRRPGRGAARRDGHARGRSRPTSPPSVVTDGGGRFRFPYLRVGAYELMVQMAGFTEAHRRIALSVGSAFEIPFVLTVEGIETSVTVHGEAPLLESARSQIATTVAVAEVESLPLNGRNFLDVALLAPSVAPPNINSTQLFAETSAVPGVGPVGRQPAQPVEQLHRRRAVGQRRRRRPERDALRRRCGGAVPGGDLGRPGRTGPGARRLRQRRHPQRHQPAARHRLRLLPRRRAERRQRAVGDDAADVAAAVRRQRRRADPPRPHLLLRERRAAAARPDRVHDHQRRPTSPSSTPGWRRSAIPASRSPPATTRTRSTASTCSARSTTPSPAAISSASATASTTSPPTTRAAPAA